MSNLKTQKPTKEQIRDYRKRNFGVNIDIISKDKKIAKKFAKHYKNYEQSHLFIDYSQYGTSFNLNHLEKNQFLFPYKEKIIAIDLNFIFSVHDLKEEYFHQSGEYFQYKLLLYTNRDLKSIIFIKEILIQILDYEGPEKIYETNKNIPMVIFLDYSIKRKNSLKETTIKSEINKIIELLKEKKVKYRLYGESR